MASSRRIKAIIAVLLGTVIVALMPSATGLLKGDVKPVYGKVITIQIRDTRHYDLGGGSYVETTTVTSSTLLPIER